MRTLLHCFMPFLPEFPQKLRASVSLPTSKSICARALVVQHLCLQPVALMGLSDSDDTQAIKQGLDTVKEEGALPKVVDIGAAGTAMRFLTALFAATPHLEVFLTGSERMQERPIGALVEALRQLGADIVYAKNKGFPPLRIRGKQLAGGTVSLPADISSQYVSALLMIAPTTLQGVSLQLVGKVASAPYIKMTIEVMKSFGMEARWEGEHIGVEAGQHYTRNCPYVVESDWSAASYWYEIVALHHDAQAKIVLKGLRENSLQGDAVCAQWFENLGVKTTFIEEGAILEKVFAESDAAHMATSNWSTNSCSQKKANEPILSLDFTDAPDLAQTFVVTSALLSRAFRFKGLKSLRIKETDRIAALCSELKKMGKQLICEGEGELYYTPTDDAPAQSLIVISTYDDHRMALAFAPAALRFPHLFIAHPEVVAKSYPTFWTHLSELTQAAEEKLCSEKMPTFE